MNQSYTPLISLNILFCSFFADSLDQFADKLVFFAPNTDISLVKDRILDVPLFNAFEMTQEQRIKMKMINNGVEEFYDVIEL